MLYCLSNVPILGGGLPIGSLLLIEEDKFVTYSKALARYFLAEGIVHKHELFVVNLDDEPQEFVSSSLIIDFLKSMLDVFYADKNNSTTMRYRHFETSQCQVTNFNWSIGYV